MADGSPYTSQPGWEANSFVEEFQNRDPRLKQTFAYPGWVTEHTDTYIQGIRGQPYIQEMNGFFTGYHMLKWFINSPDARHRNSIDTPVLRYAEVLLIYAEARAELGELTQADLDRSVNLLRDRAGMPHMTIHPSADPLLQAQFPGLSPSFWRSVANVVSSWRSKAVASTI